MKMQNEHELLYNFHENMMQQCFDAFQQYCSAVKNYVSSKTQFNHVIFQAQNVLLYVLQYIVFSHYV